MLLGGWIIIIAAYFIIVICATSVFDQLWTLVHDDKFSTYSMYGAPLPYLAINASRAP